VLKDVKKAPLLLKCLSCDSSADIDGPRTLQNEEKSPIS